jgi:5'(3')-deoxyribonucleotidase
MRCSRCSAVIRPVVAVDIDGTLGDYHHHFLEFSEVYLDRDLRRHWDGTGDWETYLGLDRRTYQELKLAYRQGGMKRSMPAFPMAAILMGEVQDAGAEVWITTTRPYNRLDNVDPDTKEWLRRNKIPFDYMLYDEHKYERLAQQVDHGRVIAVLDDLPDQCEAAARLFGHEVVIMRYAMHNRYRQHAFHGAEDLKQACRMIKSRIEGWEHGPE